MREETKHYLMQRYMLIFASYLKTFIMTKDNNGSVNDVGGMLLWNVLIAFCVHVLYASEVLNLLNLTKTEFNKKQHMLTCH